MLVVAMMAADSATAGMLVVAMMAADSATAGMLVVATVMCYFHNYRDAVVAMMAADSATAGNLVVATVGASTTLGMIMIADRHAGMLVVATVMCYFHNYGDTMLATASAATSTVGVQFPISSSL